VKSGSLTFSERCEGEVWEVASQLGDAGGLLQLAIRHAGVILVSGVKVMGRDALDWVLKSAPFSLFLWPFALPDWMRELFWNSPPTNPLTERFGQKYQLNY